MITIRSMTLDDYDAVIELMRSTPGISCATPIHAKPPRATSNATPA